MIPLATFTAKSLGKRMGKITTELQEKMGMIGKRNKLCILTESGCWASTQHIDQKTIHPASDYQTLEQRICKQHSGKKDLPFQNFNQHEKRKHLNAETDKFFKFKTGDIAWHLSALKRTRTLVEKQI